MTKIDDDIPPPKHYGPHNKKHMASELEVGQSYFVQASNEAVSFIIKKVSRATGRRFTRKAQTENGISGYRVWRLS